MELVLAQWAVQLVYVGLDIRIAIQIIHAVDHPFDQPGKAGSRQRWVLRGGVME